MLTNTPSYLREKFSDGLYMGQSVSLFVSCEDLDHIKAAARTILPDMRPQHRLEAVARAMRFKSFAAMNAALKRATPENPLLLQMAFGPRSEIIEEAFEEHLDTADLIADEDGIPLSVFGYVSTGSVFLSALYASREGSLRNLGQDAIFRIGFNDKIGGHHRAAALQRVPNQVASFLREQGAVLTLESGVEIAPVTRILGCLREDDRNLLVDDLSDALDQDFSCVDYIGEGGWFGKIALNNAVFVSDNETRIDVLPLGWFCSWPYSMGADSFQGTQISRQKQLQRLRREMKMLVKDFGVPESEVGIAYRLVPELSKEPEAKLGPDVATPRNFIESLIAVYDGRAQRA